MPITVRLRNAAGDYVATLVDPTNALGRILPLPDDEDFSLVNAIDPYGVTDFKSADMPELVEEFRRLAERELVSDDREFLAQVMRLAERSATDPTLRLRFVGD